MQPTIHVVALLFLFLFNRESLVFLLFLVYCIPSFLLLAMRECRGFTVNSVVVFYQVIYKCRVDVILMLWPTRRPVSSMYVVWHSLEVECRECQKTTKRRLQ
jgi:hypothetical protein